MTKVLVPYVSGMLHPRVVPAIRRQGFTPTLRICHNEHSLYRDVLESELDGEQDVIVIEHDIESRTGFIDDLLECKHPYCWHGYRFQHPIKETGLGPGGDFGPLGHTKFTVSAQLQLRKLYQSEEWKTHTEYGGLDLMLGWFLTKRAGLFCHYHETGDVIHHHPYPPYVRGHR